MISQFLAQVSSSGTHSEQIGIICLLKLLYLDIKGKTNKTGLLLPQSIIYGKRVLLGFDSKHSVTSNHMCVI